MKKWLKKDEELIEEIRNCTLTENELRFWYIGQCGFIFKFGNKIFIIDGVLNDFSLENGKSLLEYEPAFSPESFFADYILCTHGHADHFEVKTVQGLLKQNPEAKLLIPSGCKNLALTNGVPKKNLILLEPEHNIIIDKSLNISILPFSAAHPSHIYDKDNPDMCLSYNINFGDKSIVHLGDTYLTENLFNNLIKLKKINLFLPPINGDDFFRKQINFIGNMEAEEAAKLAARLSPELSVPTHYDMVNINTADPQRFVNQLHKEKPDLKCFLPQLGEGRTI